MDESNNPYSPPATTTEDEPNPISDETSKAPLPIVTMIALPFTIAVGKAVGERAWADPYPMNVVNVGIVAVLIIGLGAIATYEILRFFRHVSA